MGSHPFRATYGNMLQRCYNLKCRHYDNYGGRGITVCDRWRGKQGFENFVADMGPKPTPKHTLDRIENDKGYSPQNCKWATRREQLLNTRRTWTILDDSGAPHTTIELAETYGISDQLIRLRARQHKSFAEIISRHHLEPGYDRIVEGRAKSAAMNRARTHCRRGHELTAENAQIKPNGTKGCRLCNAAKTRAFRMRKKQRPS